MEDTLQKQLELILKEKDKPIKNKGQITKKSNNLSAYQVNIDSHNTYTNIDNNNEITVKNLRSEKNGDLKQQEYDKIYEEKIYPDELLILTPKLAQYMNNPLPNWQDIISAAGTYLRDELGISMKLWGEACKTLGLNRAAIALAIISTKPKTYFTHGAQGYFGGMIKRAKTNNLNLERTIWKLRIEHKNNNKLL